jgi:hypothetical protein
MTKEEMEKAADEIISKLRELDSAAQDFFGERSKNLYVAGSRLFHFKMELLQGKLETSEEVVGQNEDDRSVRRKL